MVVVVPEGGQGGAKAEREVESEEDKEASEEEDLIHAFLESAHNNHIDEE
jgi:hypothetical protein